MEHFRQREILKLRVGCDPVICHNAPDCRDGCVDKRCDRLGDRFKPDSVHFIFLLQDRIDVGLTKHYGQHENGEKRQNEHRQQHTEPESLQFILHGRSPSVSASRSAYSSGV